MNCFQLLEVILFLWALFPLLTISSSHNLNKSKIPLSKSIINQINDSCFERNSLETEELSFDLDENFDFTLIKSFVNNVDYFKNVVSYVADFLIKKCNKFLKCDAYLSALQCPMDEISSHNNLNFIRSNYMGGLMYPSEDVVSIYLSAEQHYRANVDSNNSANINILNLVYLISFSFVGIDIFASLNEHSLETDPLNNHVYFLIKGNCSYVFRVQIESCW